MKKYINNTEKTENERLEELMEKFSDKNFAYDGNHKIYILNDYDEQIKAEDSGYEIYPIAHLKNIYNRSCSLRFVQSWDLKEMYIAQGEFDNFKF